MNGKKARRLRKLHGVKHVRLIGRAERSSERIQAIKEKRRRQKRAEKPLFESPTVVPPTEKDIRRYGN